MTRLFSWFERVSTPRRVLLLLVLEIALLASENVLDYPLSVPSMRRLTGHAYLDLCAFCSASEVRAQLDAFGEAGRRWQLLLMPSIDLAIPLLSFAFGSVALAFLLRGRAGGWSGAARVLPVAALGLDLAENAAIIALVTGYPRRLEALETVLGLLSGFKFVAYVLTVGVIVALTLARRRGARPRET